MKESVITKFLVSFTGSIDYVLFPGGVFDDQIFLHYDIVWGPDWDPISGLSSGTSQMASSGRDPERVVFNLPLEMVFSSTNVFGWPQIIMTVKAHNAIGGDSLRGYVVVSMPPSTGERALTSPLIRPRPATVLGEWLAWLTGRYPELADPKMLANGKENYSFFKLEHSKTYTTILSRSPATVSYLYSFSIKNRVLRKRLFEDLNDFKRFTKTGLRQRSVNV